MRALALAYVARYATTTHKLTAYLRRKVRDAEASDLQDAIPDIVSRIAAAGFVDDALYARQKTDALARRGYGPARVRASLSDAGIAADTIEANTEEMDEIEAAREFARKRRLKQTMGSPPDAKAMQRAIAAMYRAGHRYSVTKHVLGELTDEECTAIG